MAIAATINLVLVLFNLTYIPWRDFWLRGRLQILGLTVNVPLPPVTKWYDPIKAIEPYRETQQYLETVDALKEEVYQNGLRAPEVETLLADLRRQSSEIIDNNPFALASKSGTLEKIKNRMRRHIYDTASRKQSSTEAFNSFWSQKRLSTYGWQREISFFDTQIRPLIATNYYRPIGENGEFIDYFWLYIDLPFLILFGLEFLARSFYISRRHTGVRWIDAMLWRWYDIFLFLPFWRWLRVIPVAIRLDQAELIKLERVRRQISQGIVANLAGEITEVVVVQVLNQIQAAIRRGDVTSWLIQTAQDRRPYIDINNINEMEALSGMLVQMVVYQVLPQIQPDVVAILRHNIESTLKQSPLYQGMQNLPGWANLSAQLSEQLATQVTQSAYSAIVSAMEDPVGAKLSSQLVKHFSEALSGQVQKKQTVAEIRLLLSDLVEEVKLNYVRRIEQEDVEQVLEQTRQLRQQIMRTNDNISFRSKSAEEK